MSDKIKALVILLNEDEKIALTRCEAGKPYNYLKPIKNLVKLELVSDSSWSCTELGKELVAHMSGAPYKTPVPEPKRGPAVPRPNAPKLILSKTQEGMPALAQRDTLCTACEGGIPKNDPCVWVADEGVFHPDCVVKAA